MKRNVSLIVILFVMLLAAAPMATADVPNQMNYQGQLTDDLGAPLDTIVSMTFTVYNDSGGGMVLWTETQTGVEVSGGLFNVLLGSDPPIPDTVFADDWTWLGIQIGSDPEITPLTKLVTVPYAFRVATVDGSTGGVISGDVSIQSDLDLNGDLRVTGKATIGPGHTNTGTNSFVAGQTNTVSNWGSTVGGGSSNVASEMYATVSGGGTNQASGEYSSVGGGALNIAGGPYSAVGGGENNTASGDNATVGGGVNNSATGSATVGGGDSNIASGLYSTISGGLSDTASGEFSTVGGGHDNTAGGHGATIGGGWENRADSSGATIGGGSNNTVSDGWTTIGGGWSNTASRHMSTVGGGAQNTAGNVNATVGGGGFNTASGAGATVAGGDDNTASGERSTVGGGVGNAADTSYATVSGGMDNAASGGFATVSGGHQNAARGSYSNVCGGDENEAVGGRSTVLGGYRNYTGANYSVALGGIYDTLTSNAEHSMAFGEAVYVDGWRRVVFFKGSIHGRFGLNRDDRDTIFHVIHVGTDGSNGNGAHLTFGGTWTNGSSRSFKESFQPLDSHDLLARISDLPVEAWQYKNSDERHIGPVSEDFVQAFDVGTVRSDGNRDNQYLSPGDVAGVALAGVKELVLKNEELAQQNQELKKMLEDLKQRINRLEQGK